MSKAKSKEEYCLQWKSHVTEVLYGPVGECTFAYGELSNRMRDTISKLCMEIDEVGEMLEAEGCFLEE